MAKGSPWAKFRPEPWSEKLPQLEGMEVTFCRKGDVGALASLQLQALQGRINFDALGEAVRRVVCSVVQEPHLDVDEFNATSNEVQMALFMEILTHDSKDENGPLERIAKAVDGSSMTESPESSETESGGSGEPANDSDTVTLEN